RRPAATTIAFEKSPLRRAAGTVRSGGWGKPSASTWTNTALPLWPRGSGVIDCHQQKDSIGDLIRALILVWEVYEPEEIASRGASGDIACVGGWRRHARGANDLGGRLVPGPDGGGPRPLAPSVGWQALARRSPAVGPPLPLSARAFLESVTPTSQLPPATAVRQ